jgi:protein-histidine pros-kinase
MHGQRPIIFYTNGFETYIWDDTSYAAREIYGFYKKEELEHSNRTKDQFLATMSHQLRTPLNAVLGFSEILLLKLAGDLTSEQEKQLNIINKSGKLLLSLINDLSDLAKIDSGEISFFTEEINVQELILDIVNSLKPFAEEKKLTLISQFPNKELIVRSDKRLLTQIISNIVHNAIKFTEKGSISLELQEDKKKVLVHIRDTGIGIKEEKMERLFQAFQQLFIAERKSEGSGLGLHISKKLADLIDIGLAVTSEYGKGTHFSIAIPKA